MKVCLIAEGCYPYAVGGVSSWIHSLINSFPDVEFSLIGIVADRKVRGKFVYELPPNLYEVYEVYLSDVDWSPNRKGLENDQLNWMRLSRRQHEAFRSLVIGEDIDWQGVFDLCQDERFSINELLMSPSFLEITREYYSKHYSNITFSDFLRTPRSIYQPQLLSLQVKPPKADLYHCVATGYAGVIGAMAKLMYPPATLMISEHGIYTREREEEIIRAHWVQGIYKDVWIQQFRKMSLCAYKYADKVTSLFAHAQELQVELGCSPEKTVVTPNGINVERFANSPSKDPDDPYINIGAVLRITPIKDVKTMITAFHFARQRNPALRLWLMGPDDEDKVYAQECRDLIETLNVEQVELTGRINTAEYIGKMDMSILTSISEGQPLTILESFAVKVPCIATNVGNCYGLIYGEGDDQLGAAGIVVPVMNTNAIADAILKLAASPGARARMGQVGYERLMRKNKLEYMKQTYQDLYLELGIKAGALTPDGKEKKHGRRRH